MHKCHICKSILVACHGNTSNLQSHLKKKHKKEYDQIQKKVNTSANVQPSTSTIEVNIFSFFFLLSLIIFPF